MKSLYKRTGIYAIKNKITGQMYVGQTAMNFGDRRDANFATLRHGYHTNLGLQDSWNKYGEENFEFVVLEEMDDCSNIDERERYWIAKVREDEKGFNLQSGGKGFSGMHLSDHAKKIIGEKNRVHGLGRKASEETKQKMSLARKGKKLKPETIEKLRKIRTGWKMSDEAKLKNSISHSGEKSSLAKYTKEQILKAREIYDSGNHNYRFISEQTGIAYGAINGIVKRRRWKYI